MAKVKIYVSKAFKLLGDDGKHTDYPVGNHSVEKDVAEHWFVKAHTGDEPPVDAETQAVADALLAELDAKARDLDQREAELQRAAEALQNLERQLADRSKQADQREADLNARAEALDGREVAIAEREKAADAAAKLTGQTGKK